MVPNGTTIYSSLMLDLKDWQTHFDNSSRANALAIAAIYNTQALIKSSREQIADSWLLLNRNKEEALERVRASLQSEYI